MKSLFYVIIATALVTIAPYLLTFEKGQDLTRGLFEYGIFAVLLLYVSLRDRFCNSIRKNVACVLVFYFLLVILSWLDLSTILFFKGTSVGYYGFIPFVSCIIAMLLLKGTKKIAFRQVSVILFISFFGHFFAFKFFSSQPLFQFSIPIYLTQHQSYVDRNCIPDAMKRIYNVTDSVSITKYYVDTNRSNVVVLLESWGIPMDSAMFARELSVFEASVKDRGIHFRMYSRTRTAEREDLLDFVRMDSARRRDTLFIPNKFATLGYKTTFLFGGDSTIQWRYKYIRNIGFQEVLWTDSAMADVVIAAKIDSLLNVSVCDSMVDSTCVDRRFVAWTTRDTRFPISDDAVETEKLYYERLLGTLQIVTDLAKKHPEVRFVVQGDHEPILSPIEFQRKFYRRWVPYVVLN